jgi:hypothetical protein
MIAGGATAICLGGNLNLVLLVAAAFGLAALAFYGYGVFHLYRARKRRNLELNSRMAAFAFLSLALATALTIATLALGSLPRHAGAIVFLVAFGWLSGLGLAKLYKIVPFLTWLECYGPVLGKTPTPRVQDLVIEKRAIKWFLLYFFTVWLGTVALLVGNAPGFRGTVAVMFRRNERHHRSARACPSPHRRQDNHSPGGDAQTIAAAFTLTKDRSEQFSDTGEVQV